MPRSKQRQAASPDAPLTTPEATVPSKGGSESKKDKFHDQQMRKTRICQFFVNGTCQQGQNCNFAHEGQELQVAPDLRKTRICKAFIAGKCNVPNCDFAHGNEELRSTDFCYKTTLCMWYLKGKCVNGEKCRFAHGRRQLRNQTQQAMPHTEKPQTSEATSLATVPSGVDPDKWDALLRSLADLSPQIGNEQLQSQLSALHHAAASLSPLQQKPVVKAGRVGRLAISQAENGDGRYLRNISPGSDKLEMSKMQGSILQPKFGSSQNVSCEAVKGVGSAAVVEHVFSQLTHDLQQVTHHLSSVKKRVQHITDCNSSDQQRFEESPSIPPAPALALQAQVHDLQQQVAYLSRMQAPSSIDPALDAQALLHRLQLQASAMNLERHTGFTQMPSHPHLACIDTLRSSMAPPGLDIGSQHMDCVPIVQPVMQKTIPESLFQQDMQLASFVMSL